jgi:hypothetical protein
LFGDNWSLLFSVRQLRLPHFFILHPRKNKENEKMKKRIFLICALMLALICILASCEVPTDHTHSFGEWGTEIVATCTENGTLTRFCTCGEKETLAVPASGHDWQSATCTLAEECSVCHQTKGNALGHSYKNGICSICESADPLWESKYNTALEYIEQKKYVDAYNAFKELGSFKDSATYLKRFRNVIVHYTDISGAENDLVLNANGLPIQAIRAYDYGKYIYTFAYDVYGNLIRKTYTDPDRDQTITEYSYNKDNQLITRTETAPNGEKKTSTYSYNSSGTLKKKITKYSPSDTSEAEEYSYDSERRLIQKKEWNSAGELAHINTYTYNKNGRLIREESTYFGEYGSSFIIEYDENGNCISSIETSHTGSQTIITLTYDENQRRLQAVYSDSDETFIENYVYYDEDGNLISGTPCDDVEDMITNFIFVCDEDGTVIERSLLDCEKNEYEYKFIYIPFDNLAEDVENLFNDWKEVYYTLP